MSTATLTDRITAVLGAQAAVSTALGETTVVLPAAGLAAAMTALRDHPELRFEQLIDLCGVDYAGYGKIAWSGTPYSEGASNAPLGGPAPETDATPPLGETAPDIAEGERNGLEAMPPARRFAVVYHVLSVSRNQRLRVRVFAPDDALPVLASMIPVWPSANWFEREAFDLYGIVFEGHPDLRRILTDYGFIGHPFRKDFPLTGNVEMRYDADQKRVVYQPVSIEPREITPRIVREEHYADTEGFRKG